MTCDIRDMNEPTHTTSQDDDAVARIVTDDDYLDRLARGRKVPRDALSLMLGEWRDKARTEESEAAQDAYSFFCSQQALDYKPPRRSLVPAVLVVLSIVGYSTSMNMAFHATEWVLLILAASSLLSLFATVAMLRR